MNRNYDWNEIRSFFNSIIHSLLTHVLLIPRWWAIATIFIGCLGISGWLLSFTVITVLLPGTIPIAPNTALLFIVFGVILLFTDYGLANKRYDILEKILLLFCLAIAFLTLVNLFTGYQMHIDRLINPSYDYTDGVFNGHMSPVTACLFLLTSIGLLIYHRYPAYSGYIGEMIALAGAVMILGYLYGAPFLYGGTFIPVALLTAIGFFMYGIGLFLSIHSPNFIVTGETRQSLKNQILGYFLPFIIAVLLLEGWIITWLLQKSDNTLVLAVVIITLFSIIITIVLSRYFSRIIADDIDSAHFRRKEAERELSETLMRLKLAIENAGIGFWAWDFQTDILTWDERTYEIYQVEKGTPVTIWDWVMKIHLDDRVDPEQIRDMKKQENFHGEFRVVLPDSSIIIIETHGMVIYSESGNREHMVGINWDITPKTLLIESLNNKNDELAALNEELASQEEELRSQFQELALANEGVLSAQQFTEEVISQAGEGIIVLDRTGEIETWNQFMEKYTGLSSEVTVGKNINESFSFLLPPEFPSYLKQAASGKLVMAPDRKFTISDSGIDIWYTAIYAPHRDSVGTIIGVIITVKDVTERIQIEQRLTQSENLLKASQALAKIGGWEWDVRINQMFWTEETYAIHEIDPLMFPSGVQDQIAMSINCYDEADRGIILAALERCSETGESFDLDFPFTTVKGKRIWVRTKAQAELEGGKVVKIRGTIMDITREHNLEKDKTVAITQIQRNFAELAILNDGIRNPLMIIALLVEMNCPKIYGDISVQIKQIDLIVNQLDNRWAESESVLNFLHKHYNIQLRDKNIK